MFDDLARFAGGAMSVMSGVTRQVREEIRARVDEMATRMDLVPREDFERLELMIAALEKRIAALEGKKQARATKTAPKKIQKKKSGSKK